MAEQAHRGRDESSDNSRLLMEIEELRQAYRKRREDGARPVRPSLEAAFSAALNARYERLDRAPVLDQRKE